MSDVATPSLPFTPDASIERAVTEAIDVVHEMREFRITMIANTATLGRLLDARTEDRLMLGKLELDFTRLSQRMAAMESKVDTLLIDLRELGEHFGVRHE